MKASLIRLAERGLGRWLSGERGRMIAGDLREELEARYPRRSTRATLWYLARAATLALVYGAPARARRGMAALVPALRSLVHDLRIAGRRVGRHPKLAAMALPTYAVALAACGAAWGVWHAVVRAPLPYPDGDRLVILRVVHGEGESTANLSPLEFRELRDEVSAFEHMVAIWPDSGHTDNGEWYRSFWTTAGLKEVFGLEPLVGRALTADTETDDPGLVISESYWRDHLESDAGAVGRDLRFSDEARPVVGVFPDDFVVHTTALSSAARDIDFLEAIPEHWWSTDFGLRRLERWMRTFARLRPGATLEEANAQLEAVANRWRAEHPGYDDFALRAVSMRDDLVRGLDRGLAAILGVSLLVLVMATGNVANLQLVEGIRRGRQVAIEAALGAGRPRLAARLMMEGALLGCLAGALGAAGAAILLERLPALYPGQIPRLAGIEITWPAIALTVGLGMLAGAAATLPAAWQILRVNRNDELRSRSGELPGVQRQRNLLVIAQVAGSVVLLVALALVTRSAIRAMRVDLGFEPEGLSSLFVYFPASETGGVGVRNAFERDLASRLQRLAPETRVAFGDHSPLNLEASAESPVYRFETYELPGGDELPWGRRLVETYLVRPGWFQTLGAQLLEGRTFEPRDVEVGARLAIVDEVMARRVWGDRSPLGETLRTGALEWDRSRSEEWTVVGVAAHVERGEIVPDADREAQIFYLDAADPNLVGSRAFVRSSLEHGQLIGAIRDAALRLGASRPPRTPFRYADLADQATAPYRFLAILLVGIGAAGTLLAGLGLYASLSFSVAARVRELGIRRALGAPAERLVRPVVRHTAGLVGCGILIGTLVGIGSLAWVRRLLFDVEATDPVALALAAVSMVLLGTLAAYAPARRAARVDPREALREL